ncbi:amino acid/polyamine transporter I [Aspergillus pseudotamarii]|uniref:Amino acid/polyamine transporter I n=1 Tax=Aspergillus pseudotamarii TaxID=132259 RepID=A0A5N6SYQ3_ASPPS|nr:amino acid/polyamine transporter I [Aspergillus pseudotamarii]KAE8138909.1 amino acid/polyamine transporter I [Aspergillus pseudotamarii]
MRELQDIEQKRSPQPQYGGHSPPAETRNDDADINGIIEGHPQLDRNFSVLSLIGIAFCMSNSWFGISASMITGIASGGTVLIIYGSIWITLVSMAVGASLSELASAMPNAGGQYIWVHELGPRRCAKFLSFLTGWLGYAGAIFASASVVLSLSQAILGMCEIKATHIVLTYELINFLCHILNCVGRILPTVAKISLYTSLGSFFIILITVPACARTHASAKFVFTNFVNSTGWSSDALAVVVGLVNPNWIFACLDSASHLSEEVPTPERNIPIAIFATIGIGFVTSWTYCISIFFAINDLDSLVNSPTGVPILELFNQALENKVGAICLETILVATGFGCIIACHTWQSRVCWAFSRDGGLPGHQWLSKVHDRLGVPLTAHVSSSMLVGALGLIYLGSSTAFNSMIISCISLLYVSYIIPILCLWYRKRSIRHGPFWLGRLGLFANVVTICWTMFSLVMYSFPATMPVQANNMNYVAVIYVVCMLIILVDWFLRGNRSFRSPVRAPEILQ